MDAKDSENITKELREMRETLSDLNRRMTRIENEKAQPNQAYSVPGKPTYTAPALAVKGEAMESRVTGKWFGVIGVIAVLFGAGFFLRYVFQNNLIGPTGRVLIEVLAGLVALSLGLWLYKKEKYRQYSFFLSGLGLGLFYFSVYGAQHFYALISQPVAFALMIAVTALAAILSARFSSFELTALAQVGGFLTPLLVSTGVDNQIALMTYILILNAGFLTLSYFKNWKFNYILSFLGTYLSYLIWHVKFYEPSKLWPAFFFLSLYFLIFIVYSFAGLEKLRRALKAESLVSFANSLVYFTFGYILLEARFYSFLGAFFALGAVLYFILAYRAYLNKENNSDLLYSFGLAGAALLIMAAPLQFNEYDHHWITIVWAVQAIGFILLGFYRKIVHLRWIGFSVFCLVALRLIFSDLHLGGSNTDFIFAFNIRFFDYIVSALALLAAAGVYSKNKTELSENEKKLPIIYGVAAHGAAVFGLTLEIFSLFEKKLFYSYESPQFDQDKDLINQRNLWVSIAWIIYSSIAMLIGILRRIKSARLFSIILFVIVIGKVFFYDIRELADIYRIISFITLGVILLIVSFLFYRYKEKIKEFLIG